MSDFTFTIRNYRLEDFNRYVLLNTEAEKLEPSERCISPQAIIECFNRPNYSYKQDLFIVEAANNIIGYMDMTSELSIGRIILDCWIHPNHRKKGLATKLLAQTMKRGKEMGAAVAHVNITESNTLARQVLSKLGFSYVRRFLKLNLNIKNIQWCDIKQCSTEYHHLQRGEEEKLTCIQNRAFTGTWGFNPNTVEDIIYRTNRHGSSPEDIILTYKSEKVSAYCWTELTYKRLPNSKYKGRIFMLGVDPDYQGQGLGKQILLAGLDHLKSKGIQIVELTTDSENKRACALYKSIGFKVMSSNLWYEKTVNQYTGVR